MEQQLNETDIKETWFNFNIFFFVFLFKVKFSPILNSPKNMETVAGLSTARGQLVPQCSNNSDAIKCILFKKKLFY